ncbi:GntR family transcriptional regulator [Streptomyces radicis]|uniref:GntR family transcriptional regulator n=1 Tax=Streptomyces radicis TaxID=1750517 RepID=A0A3A9WE51_9ACTN|nr:GntR family transcriptional regulator [Streptomyces radicis]RKN05926.1 GntR family transcriptional regulator [Streptomyces radicis]RKN17767.1 GntR family transcriptional regulator [Streptomyces radicis]
MSDTAGLNVEAKNGHALVDDLAGRIRGRIMSGEIAIGAQLRQAELAADFGVSRTPVREALRQLQSGGLIEVLPNRGAVVRVPAPWEVREAYEVRAELEALAAARAVSRITGEQMEELRRVNQEMYDHSVAESRGEPVGLPVSQGDNDRFHTLIADISGNARLAKVVNDVNETFPRNVSAQLIVSDTRHRDENFREHERIVAALAAGDAEAAAAEMREHVVKAGEQLAEWYEKRSSTVFRGGAGAQ